MGKGIITGKMATRKVFIDGIELPADESAQVRRHTLPPEFCWGYAGSGPAQLALAIMLRFCKSQEEAVLFYQDFKFDIVSVLEGDFILSVEAVKEWIEAKRTKWNGVQRTK
jgi:hypothetical protein